MVSVARIKTGAGGAGLDDAGVDGRAPRRGRGGVSIQDAGIEIFRDAPCLAGVAAGPTKGTGSSRQATACAIERGEPFAKLSVAGPCGDVVEPDRLVSRRDKVFQHPLNRLMLRVSSTRLFRNAPKTYNYQRPSFFRGPRTVMVPTKSI
jgi:hypothetical protein